MTLAIHGPVQLTPDIRLKEAINKYEATLSDNHKTHFRVFQWDAGKPKPSDVQAFTASIDWKTSHERSKRCYGPRLTSFLKSIQQYISSVDVVVGGSQCLPACAVWGVVRFSLQKASESSCFDELSNMIMEIGRESPMNSDLEALYPDSPLLQDALCEYHIAIVELCTDLVLFLGVGTVRQIFSFKSFKPTFSQHQHKLKSYSLLIDKQSKIEEAKRSARSHLLLERVSKQVAAQRQREEHKAKLRFLAACSTFNYEKARKEARKQGNPRWFLDDEAYIWFKENSGLVWGLGKLGSGKTVLTANILDDLILSSNNNIVAYHFCEHDEPSSLISSTILRSISKQLLIHAEAQSEDAKRLLEHAAIEFEEARQATADLDVEKVLALVEGLPSAIVNRAYIVLDGIDECHHKERKELIEGLHHTYRNSGGRFHVFCSSRPDVLQRSLGIWSPVKEIDMSAAPLQEMAYYISATLDACEESGELCVIDASVRVEIQESLLTNADGMFLWVKLLIGEICCQRSDMAILETLADLPKNLSEVFDRILRRLHESHAATDTILRGKLFKIVAGAARPLTLLEVQEAASIDPKKPTWSPKSIIIDIISALNCAGSLLVINEEELTVHFTHSSIRKHLLTSCEEHSQPKPAFTHYHFSEIEADLYLAEIVMTYLNYGDKFDRRLVPTGETSSLRPMDYSPLILNGLTPGQRAIAALGRWVRRPSRKDDRDVSSQWERVCRSLILDKTEDVGSHPFLEYAQQFWFSHSRVLALNKGSNRIEDLFDSLVAGEVDIAPPPWTPESSMDIGPKFLDCIATVRHWFLIERVIRAGVEQRLPIATESLVPWLTSLPKIDRPFDVQRIYSEALYRAAYHDQGPLLQALIARGADVDTLQDGKTPLEVASLFGFDSIIASLLLGGANPDARGPNFDGAVNAAAEGGYKEIIELLINNGADVSMHPRAFQTAAGHDDKAILELLNESFSLRMQRRIDDPSSVLIKSMTAPSLELESSDAETLKKHIPMGISKARKQQGLSLSKTRLLPPSMTVGH